MQRTKTRPEPRRSILYMMIRSARLALLVDSTVDHGDSSRDRADRATGNHASESAATIDDRSSAPAPSFVDFMERRGGRAALKNKKRETNC